MSDEVTQNEVTQSLMNFRASGPVSGPSRRDVLATLAVAGCACALGSSASAADPSDRAPPAKAEKSDLGAMTDFAADGPYDKFSRDKQVFVFRNGDTLFASSSLCTHKRCILKKAPDATKLHCPCHQSDFDLEGIPMSGPAKSSLVRVGISIENDHLFVDTTKTFAEKDWKKDGASVKVK